MEDAIHILDREVLVEAWRWHFVEAFGQQLHMRGKSIMTELNWWVFVAFMAPPIKQQLLDKVSDTIKYADLLIDGDTISEVPVIVAHPCRCNTCKEETNNRRGDGSDEPQWPSFEC